MPESPKPLAHQDAERKDDDALAREARTFLLAHPAVQLLAELLTKLREADLPWWSPQALRETWPAADRMRWLASRADVRQRVTTALTGFAPKAARKKPPEFQAALIDSALDEGDVTVRAFDEAFSPVELAVYGPAPALWRAFRERFPWDDRRPAHRELVAWLLAGLLADKSSIDDLKRAPILTPWDVRTAVDSRAWHTHMPLEVRAAIDDARLQREKSNPRDPFHAAADLAIALPDVIAANMPLRDLAGVFDAAERAMGLAAPPTEVAPAQGPKPVEGAAPAPAPAASPRPGGPAEPLPSAPPPGRGLPPEVVTSAGVVGASTKVGANPAASNAPPRAAANSSPPGPAPGRPSGAAVKAEPAAKAEPAHAPAARPDDAPATTRGESLRALAAAAVENLVSHQGLQPLFDDDEVQSFVEIDPLDDIEQTNTTSPKIALPLTGPTRR
jgi:hypothetical protein